MRENPAGAEAGRCAANEAAQPVRAMVTPASQAWFWTGSRQEGERRAEAGIAAGRTATYGDAGALMDGLDVGEWQRGGVRVAGISRPKPGKT